MNEDKNNAIERAADALVWLDKSQELIEGMAFDILNCSDFIKNATMKLAKAMEMSGMLGNENKAASGIIDCLEELSTFSENMYVCAHRNEEASARQHELIKEIEQVLEYMGSLV